MAALTVGPCARAGELAEGMLCSKLVSAMDGRSQNKIRQSAVTVLNIMGKIDSAHIQHGEPGIMSQLNKQGGVAMAELTSVHCREHPDMTIFNAAAYVYSGIRSLLIQIGAAQ